MALFFYRCHRRVFVMRWIKPEVFGRIHAGVPFEAMDVPPPPPPPSIPPPPTSSSSNLYMQRFPDPTWPVYQLPYPQSFLPPPISSPRNYIQPPPIPIIPAGTPNQYEDDENSDVLMGSMVFPQTPFYSGGFPHSEETTNDENILPGYTPNHNPNAVQRFPTKQPNVPISYPTSETPGVFTANPPPARTPTMVATIIFPDDHPDHPGQIMYSQPGVVTKTSSKIQIPQKNPPKKRKTEFQ